MQKTIYCRHLSSGKCTEFNSLSEAAIFLGVDESSIRKPLKKHGKYFKKGYVLYKDQQKPDERPTKQLPKILVLDIETAPAIVYAWRLWDANLSHQMVKQDWYIISVAAKWLDLPVGTVLVQTPEEARNQDDSRIVRETWQLLDRADIVIVHNGKSFDIPKLNTRFLMQELPPPSPYQIIDTKLAMNGGNMSFLSNSLDYLTRILDIDHKGKTEFQLWVDCMAGFESALEDMARYNYNDVVILERLYMKIRPWIRAHPNLALLVDASEYNESEHICPVCLSTNHEEVSNYVTTVNSFAAHRCLDCGTISRELKRSTTKEHKELLLSNLPTK